MGNWIPAFQGNVVPSLIRFFKDVPALEGKGTVFPWNRFWLCSNTPYPGRMVSVATLVQKLYNNSQTKWYYTFW